MEEELEPDLRSQLNDALDSTYTAAREAEAGHPIGADVDTAQLNHQYIEALLDDEDGKKLTDWVPPEQR